MSNTFFTKSGSSPGDADWPRPPSQRPPQKKPIKRAFTGMAGTPLARIEEPIITPAEPMTIEAQPALTLTPEAYAARKRRAAATAARLVAKAKVQERAKIPPAQRKIEDQKNSWRDMAHDEAGNGRKRLPRKNEGEKTTAA